MASDLSYNDKKVLSEATDFVKLEENSVNEFIKNFADKGYLGLWMDAKGFWETSDQQTVLKCMEDYRQIHKGILACIQLATENDGNAYKQIVNLYEKLEEMEREADAHLNGKSKALCSLAKNFLDNHWKLDHNLKRVECVVLEQDIKKTKETVEKLNKKLDEAIENFEKLQRDNRKLQKSVDDLKKENRDFKDRMESLILESNERGDQRLREMMEETRRNMENMMREMRDNNPGPR